MRVLASTSGAIALITLAACSAPSHPLTYVHPSDPMWWLGEQQALVTTPDTPAATGPNDVHSAAPIVQNPTIAAMTPSTASWHPLVNTDSRIKQSSIVTVSR